MLIQLRRCRTPIGCPACPAVWSDADWCAQSRPATEPIASPVHIQSPLASPCERCERVPGCLASQFSSVAVHFFFFFEAARRLDLVFVIVFRLIEVFIFRSLWLRSAVFFFYFPCVCVFYGKTFISCFGRFLSRQTSSCFSLSPLVALFCLL